MKGRHPHRSHDGRLLKGRSVRFRLDECKDRITDTTINDSCFGSAKTKNRNPATPAVTLVNTTVITANKDVSVEPKLAVTTQHLSLSATEQRRWEKTLQEQYVLDNLLRNNKTPLGHNSWEVEEEDAAKEPLRILNLSKRRTDLTNTTTTTTTSINNSEDADASDQKGGSEALLVKLSRQAVIDPQNLDITLLQYVDYDDTNVSLLFNLYNVMIRYDHYHLHQQQQEQQPQEQHLHNHGATIVTNLLEFMNYLKRTGVLLKSSMVVTLYDVFVQLVQMNPQANIVLAETGNKNNDSSTKNTGPTTNIIIRYHMDRRAIGSHPELLRILPWYVTTRTTKDDSTVVKNHSFLEDWFPFDKIEPKNDQAYNCTYRGRDCEDVVFPPLVEIDTTIQTDEWITSLRFGESASCRFLESSYDEEEEDSALLVGEQLHHPHLQGDSSSSSSLELPVARRGVKPQPSCGDIQPDSPTNHCLSTSRSRVSVSTTFNTCCPAMAAAIANNSSSGPPINQGRNKPTTDITTRTIPPIGNDIFSIKGADSYTNNDTTCQQGNIVKTDPKQTQTQCNTMDVLAKSIRRVTIDLHGPIPPRDITVVNHHLVHQYHDVSSRTTTTSRSTRTKRFFRVTTSGTDDDHTDMTSTCNFQWLSTTTTAATTPTPRPNKVPSFSQLDDDYASWFPPDADDMTVLTYSSSEEAAVSRK